MVRRMWSVFVACAVLARPANAAVNERPVKEQSFGTPGQIVLTNGAAFTADTYMSSTPNTATRTVIAVSPALDLFVLPGLSLGGQIGYSKGWSTFAGQTTTSDSASIGPTVGYAWNLSDDLTLWPTAHVGYGLSWTREGIGFASTGQRSTGFSVGGAVPLLFHLAPHFFLGFGPSVQHGLASNPAGTFKQTRLSASTFIGGWL